MFASPAPSKVVGLTGAQSVFAELNEMPFPPFAPKVLLCTVYLTLAMCDLVCVCVCVCVRVCMRALSQLGLKVIKIGTYAFGVLPMICK